MPTEDQNKELADKVEEIIQYLDLDGKDDYVVTKSGRLFNETPKNMRI